MNKLNSMLPLVDKYLLVVSDIHGDYDDFMYYLNLWLDDMSNHIVFMGDLIHADCKKVDDSLLILDMVREYIEYPSFHVLLGNHELSQILGDNSYRYGVNQVDVFRELVEEAYPNEYTVKYKEYVNLLKLFRPCLITSNGLFIIHSGIHEDYIEPLLNDSFNIDGLVDFDRITFDEKKILTEHLWARPYSDYMEDTITKILQHYNCQYMISGHTNYNGSHVLGNQLIFNSSHNVENKYYLKVKLNQKYTDIIELMKQLKKYG